MFKNIADKLKLVSKEHEAWFKIGLHTFSVTWNLGFDLIAFSETEVKAVLDRPDVKKLGIQLFIGFQDLGWAPDRIEASMPTNMSHFYGKKDLDVGFSIQTWR